MDDLLKEIIKYFTVVCLVARPVNESEVGVGLFLIGWFSYVNSY